MAISAAQYRPETEYPNVNAFGVVAGVGYIEPNSADNENVARDGTVQHQSFIIAPPNFTEEVNLYEIDQLLQERDFFGAVEKIMNAAVMGFSEEGYERLSQYASEAIKGLANEGDNHGADSFAKDLSALGLDLNEDILSTSQDQQPDTDPSFGEDTNPAPSQKAEIDHKIWVKNQVLQLNPWELQWRQQIGTLNLSL